MTYESLIGIRPPSEHFALVDIYDDGGQTITFNGKQFLMTADSTFGPDDVRTKELTSAHAGIRPRWAKVIGIHSSATDHGLGIGDKVLLDTLKWSRGIEFDSTLRGQRLWRIPIDDILMVDTDGFTEQELEIMKDRKHAGEQS